MKVQLANEGDKESWNAVVKESENGTIYHTWEWKEVIEKGFGDKTYPLVIEDNGEIIGVFPFFTRANFKYSNVLGRLPLIRSMFETLYSPHPQVWGYGGPCFLQNISNKKAYEFFTFVENLVKKNKRILGYRIFPFNEASLAGILHPLNYRRIEWQTAFIDLDVDIEKLWTNLKKKHRTAVRKARKEGLDIKESKRKKDIREFYDILWTDLINHLNQVSDKHLIYSPKYTPKSYFETIYKVLVPKKMAKFFFVEYNGNKIGSMLTLYYKRMMTYQHSASLRKFMNLNPNNLLLWHAIEDGKKQGIGLFDLAGIPLDETDGVYRFKAGWGGKIKKVNWYYREHRWKNVRKLKKSLSI
jgi:lipid II:glycine glycyltransferase (peptidoglycan interpeptide bridge formation enzyme)